MDKQPFSFSDTTIGFFLKPANKKVADLIVDALEKEGVKIITLNFEHELDVLIWENISKRPYAIIFDEELTDEEFIDSMLEVKILPVSMSFHANFQPVVVADRDPLNLFLRDLFSGQEVKV